ncbi:MAG: T9SS type A sorting domain-containing protein [Lentimicrobium sp.]|nr:T9SS type A sorting domain-containing protein [Lentimicrobium sp.]
MKPGKKTTLIFAILMSGICILRAQTFTEMNYFITNIYGSSDWGDYDNDGDLDLLVTGSTNSMDNSTIFVYKNNGDGTFASQNGLALEGVSFGVGKWIDFNNDGLLDIFTSGQVYDSWGLDQPACFVYIGKTGGSFERLESDDVFIKTVFSSMACGDINNDGFADIAVTGFTEMNPSYHAKIYENHTGEFVESNKFKIDSLINGSLEWGDFDNDLDLDLLISGWRYDWDSKAGVWETAIYRNDIDSLKKLQTSFQGVTYGSASWGDCDKDGDLDILVTGIYEVNGLEKSFFRIYKNSGNGSFLPLLSPNIPNIYFNSSIWGDIDNDGDLDILATGRSGSYEDEYTYLLINENGNIINYVLLCGVQASSLNMVDYDNDGDLDVFLTGWADYTGQTKIFRNNLTVENLPPSPPTNLSAIRNGNKVTFSWQPSTDDHTDFENLTYNIYVGTQPESATIMQPCADINTGFRKIANFGNTSLNTSWSLTLPDEATDYYWGVQAIDNSFLGSEFTDYTSINMPPIVFTDEPSEQDARKINFNGRVNPGGQSLYAWFEYGSDTTMLTTTKRVLVSGDSLIHVTTRINELMYDRLYYYRIVAGSDTLFSSDAVKGAFVSFRTEPDGIHEMNNPIVIYPNPSDGLFNYALKEKSEGVITIYDLKGRKCMQLSCNHFQHNGVIDIRSLDNGIYNAVIISDTRVLNYRLVKQ